MLPEARQDVPMEGLEPLSQRPGAPDRVAGAPEPCSQLAHSHCKKLGRNEVAGVVLAAAGRDAALSPAGLCFRFRVCRRKLSIASALAQSQSPHRHPKHSCAELHPFSFLLPLPPLP